MNMNKTHATMTAMMAVLMLPPCLSRAQDTSRNFVKTVTMLDADGTDSLQAVQYYNGLGWPTVSVATAGADGGTACAMTTYDGLGREKRKYVPVPGNGLDYMTESDILSKAWFHNDPGGYAQSHHDALDRVTAVDAAGIRWRMAGKQDRIEHLANTSSDMALHYEAPDNGSNSLTLPEDTSFQYYPEGSLVKTVSYDADSVCVTVFTDLTGKKILERTAAGDTYYVYNDLGQLRFVLTPAFEEISRSKTMFAYEYRYDNRGRVSMKVLPKDGTEGSVTEYWYDKADRLAYMRDPALGGRYRFYLYDRLGRLCVQGTCTNRSSLCGSRLAKVSYASGTGGICQTGYTAPYFIVNPQLEMVNYYDNYGFIGNNFANAMPTVNIDATQEQHATGSLTGRVVYATDGEALGTVNVYDQKGQVVRYVGKRLGGLVEDVRTAYSFTGAVDTVQVDVNVGYGGSLVATTVYTYDHGMKTKMKLSVSHGRPVQSRETEYTYDAVGRLTGKDRQLTGTGKSSCSYTYDVHGWLTSVIEGEFQERLYYADGLDGGCWNGNISTMKWTGAGAGGAYQGYNLEYDGCNRLHDAAYGEGDNLANYRNYFSEHADYDCNGNITRLRRRGLVDNLHGGFGLVDNLYMTYEGNMLTSVCDSASHLPYSSATDFDGVPGQEYPLTYNGAGSLVSDAGRGITFVTYDANNNPQQIYFANGNDTKYVYDASGRKLRVIHFTAVPNIMRKFGRKPADLTPSQILYADTTDYLLGGSLTLRNGRIDKLQ
ncbi:MAG: hypothetical protein IKH88_02135, partial [Prevotella sp.]|nr:hypothetical protein [Prevotella sp.]